MREFCLEDTDAVFEFSTHPDVVRYTGDAGAVKTPADAQKIITDIWQAEYREFGYARYALIYKPDNRVIGFCGIKFEPELGGPDIGYRMLPQYWGKGLATEAVGAVMNYATDTLGVEHIYGEVVAENSASIQVLLKLGFMQIESYQKQGFTINRYEINKSGMWRLNELTRR